MVVRLPPYVARPFRFAQPTAQLAERTTQNGLLDTRPLGCWDGVDEDGGLPSTHPTSAMLFSVFHTHDDITSLTSGERLTIARLRTPAASSAASSELRLMGKASVL